MDERTFLHPKNPLSGETSIDETDFVRVFSFAIEQDLGKVVSLSRTGRSVKVVIRYIQTETLMKPRRVSRRTVRCRWWKRSAAST